MKAWLKSIQFVLAIWSLNLEWSEKGFSEHQSSLDVLKSLRECDLKY